jgi:NTP pyrophosphatase (non-canonical NTP hydrolase)
MSKRETLGETLDRAARVLSIEHNRDKTLEECGELISELIREKQGRPGVDIDGEIADVAICLAILIRQRDSDGYEAAYDRKLNRLRFRLDEIEARAKETT